MKTILTDFEQLSQPSEPLTFLAEEGVQAEEGTKIIEALKKTMEVNTELLALSAPQIGIKKRIFCLRFNDQIKTFINPIITKKNGLKVVIETCASMPGKEIVIGRPEEITVVYYNDEFKYEDNKLVGAAASLFDQQAQLLDGVLPSELGLVSDIEQDGKIEEADLEEIISFYKDTFLPTKLNRLTKNIEEDKEALKNYNSLKFTEGVINGRITVVETERETKNHAAAKKAANKAVIQMNKTQKAEQKRDFNNFIRKVNKKTHR